MMEVYLGTILSFAFNYPPRGWAACNGQLVAITQNSALFSLLGTIYGGDGVTTFGLPDLRGRTPIHYGQGPGLSNFVIGQRAGSETMTLLVNNMPAHSHPLAGTATAAVSVTANSVVGGTITNITDAGNNSFSSGGSTPNVYSEPGGSGTDAIGGFTAAAAIGGNTGVIGGTQPFGLHSPFLVVNMCIATSGIFPSRN
ncbi:phage tail protein [Flavobacterium tyrosinilyticum]|uniref:phage tail protein n=1 Tax=Flavobacterium tyrosinilyticum TaxID=1658740 RepID=UPI00202E0E0C|nr:tail fiber protein [Flavobacterium tyrosinilyticum]MCM0668836.1 tail fiber protein [Flavobacterium tyrosinilyticum]